MCKYKKKQKVHKKTLQKSCKKVIDHYSFALLLVYCNIFHVSSRLVKENVLVQKQQKKKKVIM